MHYRGKIHRDRGGDKKNAARFPPQKMICYGTAIMQSKLIGFIENSYSLNGICNKSIFRKVIQVMVKLLDLRIMIGKKGFPIRKWFATPSDMIKIMQSKLIGFIENYYSLLKEYIKTYLQGNNSSHCYIYESWWTKRDHRLDHPFPIGINVDRMIMYRNNHFRLECKKDDFYSIYHI